MTGSAAGARRVAILAAALAALLAHFGGAQLSPAAAPLLGRSLRVAFSVFALLCVAGVPASLARGRIARAQP